MRTARMTLALVLVFAAVALVPAQTPPPATTTVQTPPPTGTPVQTPAAPGRGGGGGRGRGGTVIMTLTAPWAPGAEIPLKYTQAGGEVSPALSWDNPPETVVSFALIVHDVSAPVNPGTDDMLHWMVWNIPGSTRSLAEAIPFGPELPDKSRQISGTGPYYRGPGAPATGAPHHYMFEIYALDAPIDVPAVGQSPPLTRAAVEAAMVGKIRARGTLVGLFKR